MVIDKQLADQGIELDKLKRITIGQLRELGYALSSRQLPLGNRPYRYGIMEVIHEDRKIQDVVTFAYLYSTLDQTGIILPYGYDYYISHPLL